MQFVGHCYADSIMFGEAVSCNEDDADLFTLV